MTLVSYLFLFLATIQTRPETRYPSFIGIMGFPASQTHTVSPFTVISMSVFVKGLTDCFHPK